MGEFSLGMLLDIALNLVPVALVIPDFFAVGANGQKSAQGFHLCQGLFQILVFFNQLRIGEVQLFRPCFNGVFKIQLMLQKLEFSPFSLPSLPEGQDDGTKGDDKGDGDDEDIPFCFPVPFLKDILFGMHNRYMVRQAPDLIGRDNFIPALMAFEAAADDIVIG